MKIIVCHISGTGFNAKSVLELDVDPANESPVRDLLKDAKGLSRSAFTGLLDQLRSFGSLSDLGFKGYRKGLQGENPTWPTASFWPSK